MANHLHKNLHEANENAEKHPRFACKDTAGAPRKSNLSSTLRQSNHGVFNRCSPISIQNLGDSARGTTAHGAVVVSINMMCVVEGEKEHRHLWISE